MNVNMEFCNVRHKAYDDALTLANRTLELRLEKLNELRSQVLEDRAKYLTIEKSIGNEKALDIRLKSLELWRSKVYGYALALGAVSGGFAFIISKIFGF